MRLIDIPLAMAIIVIHFFSSFIRMNTGATTSSVQEGAVHSTHINSCHCYRHKWLSFDAISSQLSTGARYGCQRTPNTFSSWMLHSFIFINALYWCYTHKHPLRHRRRLSLSSLSMKKNQYNLFKMNWKKRESVASTAQQHGQKKYSNSNRHRIERSSIHIYSRCNQNERQHSAPMLLLS